IDGRSGSGKSTLAREVATTTPVDVSIIEGDDFYAGGTAAFWDGLSAEDKVGHCIDWRRQRPVLDELRRGRIASWRPFDWEAFDGSLTAEADRCPPDTIVILEGAYSARPELADLLDLRVLLDTSDRLRRARLIEREGEAYVDDWYRRWSEAEDHYFGQIMTAERFDLVLRSG
ncbi:MAG: hypothetical protein AAFO29_10900, partial [Actinomycetota bacterium]